MNQRRLAWYIIGIVFCQLAPGLGLAAAQPRGGILRGTIVNGTTGGSGRAERVRLVRMQEGLTPIATLEEVSGSFEMSELELEGQVPVLLQVTSGGVNYNQPVRFGRGYEAQAEVTVYDILPEWNDTDLEVSTSRILFQRHGDRLQIDEVYVVTNSTSPPRTYFNEEGTFRFDLPTKELVELRGVSAEGTSGMSVPQPASPVDGGPGYATRTAFKPGETTMAISYVVRYGDNGYVMQSQAYHRFSELLAIVAPADLQVEAEGWESLGTEPQGRYAAFRLADVNAGDPIRFSLRGGSAEAGDLVGGSSSSNQANQANQGGGAAAGGAPRGPITRIPDNSLSAKWVIICLMAAALAYGLLSTLLSRARDVSGRPSRTD